MKRILFFKAEQFNLFDAPVNVKAGVRNGKAVKPYTRVQKIKPLEHPVKAKDANSGTGRFTVTIPKVGNVHADSLEALGEAAWKAVHENGPGYGYSEIGSGWPVIHSNGHQIGTLRYNGRFDATPTEVENVDHDHIAMQRYAQGLRSEDAQVQAAVRSVQKDYAAAFPKKEEATKQPAKKKSQMSGGGYYGVGTRADGSKGMVMGGPTTDWSKPWGKFASVEHHGSKRAALEAMTKPMGGQKKSSVPGPKTLADKKGSNGRRYRLQARGDAFDVIGQDAYSWKYVNGGKAIKDEASARNLFDAMTL